MDGFVITMACMLLGFACTFGALAGATKWPSLWWLVLSTGGWIVAIVITTALVA